MNTKRIKDVMACARSIKKAWGADPLDIADRLGIKINEMESQGVPSAYIVKQDGYPAVIQMKGCRNLREMMVLCAHELGHYFLHAECGFAKFHDNNVDSEYEANLFAVTLLCEDDMFNMPIAKMSGSILRSIMDYNLRR